MNKTFSHPGRCTLLCLAGLGILSTAAHGSLPPRISLSSSLSSSLPSGTGSAPVAAPPDGYSSTEEDEVRVEVQTLPPSGSFLWQLGLARMGLPLPGAGAEDEEGAPAGTRRERQDGFRPQPDAAHPLITYRDYDDLDDGELPQFFTIDWQGHSRAMAGWSGPGPAPNDGSALGTLLDAITDMTTAANGDLYFVHEHDGPDDPDLHRICRVGADGRIVTLFESKNRISALAISPRDQLVYYALASPVRFMKICEDGRHEKVWPSPQARARAWSTSSCHSMAFTPGGDLIFCAKQLGPSQTYRFQINKILAGEGGLIGATSAILTLAGKGTQTLVSAPGLPILARDAQLFWPQQLHVDAEGAIYFLQKMPWSDDIRLYPDGEILRGSQLCKITPTGHLLRIAGGAKVLPTPLPSPALGTVLEGSPGTRITSYRVFPGGEVVLVLTSHKLMLIGSENDQVLDWLVRRGLEQLRLWTRRERKDGVAVLAARDRLMAVRHVIQTGLFKHPNFMPTKYSSLLRGRETGTLRGGQGRRLEAKGNSFIDDLRAKAALALLLAPGEAHAGVLPQVPAWTLEELREALPEFPQPQAALAVELSCHDRQLATPHPSEPGAQADEGKEEMKETAPLQREREVKGGPLPLPSSSSSSSSSSSASSAFPLPFDGK